MLYACREHPAVQRVLDTGEPEFTHVTIADCGHEVYDYALAHDFRFLSYGDSSLLLP